MQRINIFKYLNKYYNNYEECFLLSKNYPGEVFFRFIAFK